MFFNFLTIVSFILSSWLSITEILNRFQKPKFEVVNCFHVGHDVHLKIVVINNSNKQKFIDSACLIPENNSNEGFNPTTYEALVVSKGSRSLRSKSIPINIPANSGTSFYLSFQHKKLLASDILSGDCVLILKTGKQISKTKFNYYKTEHRLDTLAKELD